MLRRIALGLAVLIGTLIVLSAVSNFGLADATAEPDRLDDGDRARIAEVMHLRAALGDSVWPGFGAADIPIVLYNESFVFLAGYRDPPPGWVRPPYEEFMGGPWEPVRDGDASDEVYYRQPHDGPDATPQAFTVRVGLRWAASMTTKRWTEISLRRQIRADLPVLLRPVVPYRLVGALFSTDWYVSAVIHEAFHAFQAARAPARFRIAETGLTARMDGYPTNDSGHTGAWRDELRLLATSTSAGSRDEALEYARSFLSARDARRLAHGLGPDDARYEQDREWLEGLAKYAELYIWRLAASVPGYEPTLAILDDRGFRGYSRSYPRRWRQEVAQFPRSARSHGDGRFYYSGMGQALLLDATFPEWKALALEDGGASLEDLLREAVRGAPDLDL